MIYCQDKNLEYSFEFSPLWSAVSGSNSGLSTTGTGMSVARVELRTEKLIEPTGGLALIATGSSTKSELGGTLGIEKVTFSDTYYYLAILAGGKFSFDRYFMLLESGLGYNYSNKTRTKTEFTNGEKETMRDNATLNSGEFNKLTIPLVLSVARKFKVRKNEVYLGLKAYYGINQVVTNVPRNNHYYGLGFTVGIIF